MQPNGVQDVCGTPYEYGSTCSFRCSAGYQLPADGVSSLTCTLKRLYGEEESTMGWDRQPSACEGGAL